jgi:hypothetical protein
LNGIADPDGPLEQDDQPPDEVIDDVLQAEPDADSERSAQDGHPIEVHAQHEERQDEADEDDGVAEQARQRIRQGCAEIETRKDVLLEHEAGQGREEELLRHAPSSGQNPRGMIAGRGRQLDRH